MSNTAAKYRAPLGDKLWRWTVISLPYWWLAVFFLAPFAIVFKISFADPIVAQPPFTSFFDFGSGASNWLLATLDNYRFLTEDNLYWISYFTLTDAGNFAVLDILSAASLCLDRHAR
jgi:ABC-type spermidine/putrescine transport system permease subunit I